MKFLQEMISRKRQQQQSEPEAELADPMPLHEALKAEQASKASGDAPLGGAPGGSAEILNYPDAGGAAAPDGSESRTVLEDDGDYDWDLSEIEPYETEEEAAAAASELERRLAQEARPEPAATADDAPDADETTQDIEDRDAFEVADVMAALKAQTTEAPAVDETEEMEEAPAEMSFDAWHAEAATAKPAAAEPTGQQAMLATIRAARERAERTRQDDESGVSKPASAKPAPQVVPEPAPEPVAVAAPEPVAEPEPVAKAPEPAPEPELVQEQDVQAADLSAEDVAADDVPEVAAGHDGDAMADEIAATPEVAEEIAEETMAEADTQPAPANRKIWDIHDEDDHEPALTVGVFDTSEEEDADDEAAAAASDAVQPEAGDDTLDRLIGDTVADEPESDPEEVPAALAPMTAPKRRAGRVKTRLLGFNKTDAADVDPIKAAAPSQQSDTPTFPVGWVIVVKGPGRGACFTLGAGASKIGRGEDQPVRLNFGDTSISRDNHAVVAYDNEQRKFFLGHGGKANLVRLNDMPVLATEPLTDADLIRIGETTLRFVALCGPEFSWEDEADQAGEWHGAAQ